MAHNTGTMKSKSEERPSSMGSLGSEVKQKTQEAASTVADKGREAASAVADKARETFASVSERAQEGAAAVGHTVGDMASNLGQKAENATSAVGSGMESLAGTIRERAPHGGILGSAGAAVADSLESGGRYLQEEGLSGMGDDLTNLIRRNPVPALLIGIGLGYLFARATRS